MSYSSEEDARLLDLLDMELGKFEQIRIMTGKQAELLAADDLEEFNKSLDSRQELIEEINGLHQETNVLMQSYISFAGPRRGAKGGRVETALGRLRKAVAECTEMNAKNLAAAKDMAGDYSRRIEKLNLSRKSLGAYALGVPNNSELFDKKT